MKPHLTAPPVSGGGTAQLENAGKRNEILPLTSLRFFAAMHVVLFHTWAVFLPSLPGSAYWNQFVSLGYAGVSLSFVLSGYILAVVYLRGDGSKRLDLRRFWSARFARVYPLYAFSFLVSVPIELRNLGQHSLAYKAVKFGVESVVNFGMLQAWHPVLGGGWNKPAWSVSTEAFFYLCFPVVGVWVWRKLAKPVPLVLALLGFWLLTIVTSLAISAHFGAPASTYNSESARFNPLLRLPEFVVGICAAKWQLQRRGFRQAGSLTSGSLMWGSIVILAVSVPLLVRCPPVAVSNGLLAPVFAALIVGLSVSHGLPARLLSARWLVTLGHASFSIYLLHVPLLQWWGIVWPGAFSTEHNSWMGFCAFVMMLIALSVATYRWIEAPGRRMILKYFNLLRLRRPVEPAASNVLI